MNPVDPKLRTLFVETEDVSSSTDAYCNVDYWIKTSRCVFVFGCSWPDAEFFKCSKGAKNGGT